jgi:hypothetical protein
MVIRPEGAQPADPENTGAKMPPPFPTTELLLTVDDVTVTEYAAIPPPSP